jgi:hypothetical protein
LTAPRKFGKPFIEQWWKTNGRKKLGEVFSHEDPSVLFMLDPYPFFYGTFIEHDGTSLKWKGIPGTKFIDLGGNQSLIPWKNDRRFRLLYLWPMMLALNATIVDYMHTGNAYCASCYLDFMVSGMYDKRLGNDFVDGMEGKSYPIVSTKPFPRKSPTLGPQNEWTGDINTSEFELLYCCMKAGITLGLDSLGFTNLYEQLP